VIHRAIWHQFHHCCVRGLLVARWHTRGSSKARSREAARPSSRYPWMYLAADICQLQFAVWLPCRKLAQAWVDHVTCVNKHGNPLAGVSGKRHSARWRSASGRCWAALSSRPQLDTHCSLLPSHFHLTLLLKPVLQSNLVHCPRRHAPRISYHRGSIDRALMALTMLVVVRLPLLAGRYNEINVSMHLHSYLYLGTLQSWHEVINFETSPLGREVRAAQLDDNKVPMRYLRYLPPVVGWVLH
jgi:hypothetical protein